MSENYGAKTMEFLEKTEPVTALKQSKETAVRSGVAQWITTLRCDYNELPAKLASGKEPPVFAAWG